jgi:alpha-beta hydrolase superfamily lysophospholipase
MLALILAATVWPGFAMEKIPVAIYDGKRTTLHDHPAPPPEFRNMVYEGRHPLVNANSSVQLGGVETATIVSPSPTPALIAHEKFHVHQRTKHPSWSANEADLFVYPDDDVEALALQQREFDALRIALTGDGCAARLALALRRERFAKIGATAAAYERGTELNEGLATYVEQQISKAPVVLKKVDGVRERMYQSGLALATLLDRHDPGWKTTLENGDPRSLDELLTAAVEPRTTAAEDVQALRTRREQRKRDFLEAKGWTVVITGLFFPERFDPLNVHVVGKGEVLHTRMLRLKGDGGVIDVVGRQVLTEAAGVHPLFNGVKRVVLTGFEEKPEVVDGKLVAAGVSAILTPMSDLHIVNAPVENPRGTLLLVHGLGEHSGRYGHVIQLAHDAGFSVLAYDHRGHGRSPGRKGVLPKTTTMLEDLASIVDMVTVRPLVLLGHSMGGAVASRFVAEALTEHGEEPAKWHRKVDFLALSSPALASRLKTVDRIKLAIGRALTPSLAIPNGLDPDKVSHDPEVVRAYKADPLNHDRVTPRLVDFILGAGKVVRDRAGKWRVPTLLMFAGADELVDPKGSRAFVFAAPRYVVKAHEFPGAYHELFNETEPTRGEALAMLREWLESDVARTSARE